MNSVITASERVPPMFCGEDTSCVEVGVAIGIIGGIATLRRDLQDSWLGAMRSVSFS